MEDSTLKEFPEESVTLAEKPSSPYKTADRDSLLSETTLRYGSPDEDADSGREAAGLFALGKGNFFRGWFIQEQLPTKGAEADIYLVQAEKECCVLKLYRHRLEPKLEVLNRVAEISRSNSRFFVVFKDVGFDEYTGRWYEVQEYFPLGSLLDVSLQAKRAPGFLKNLVSELTEAIHCLHLNKIIHCDIKPANVLIRSLEPLDLVLTDFGIASILASDMSQKMTRLKGTPMYWAPEVFSRMIGRPCDWWGLGMIVLELLVGEHPLEGLTDSQIIRKLTVGNIEVPDSLEQDWILLVKGLLTKDDGLRWGQAEIVRWLSGERDIPLRYEESAASKTSKRLKVPFLFEGKEYFTPERLAQAFAASQNPWFSGMSVLREIRRWFEENMLFDEAMALGNDIVKLDSELTLFRFVHGNAQGPFSLMGKRVDADNLSLFLERVIHSEAWSAERRIAGMLGNGRLLAFYDEYVSLSGSPARRDPFFYRLLLFMNKKTLEEQWGYFDAMRNPDVYLWPDGRQAQMSGEPRSIDSQSKILETLEKMGTIPLKRAAFEESEKFYVLPRTLPALFRSISTYASGVQWFEDCRIRDLLIPRDFVSDPSIYENLSLDEYTQAARAHWLGQTSAILAKLTFLIEALPKLPCNPLGTEILSRTVARLEKLKIQKITQIDSLFVAEAAKLYEERREIARRRLRCFPAVSGGSGLVFCGFRLLSGNARGSVLFWGVLFFVAMIGLALKGTSVLMGVPLRRAFSQEFANSTERGDITMSRAMNQAFWGAVVIFCALIYFRVFVSYPYPFSFLIGAIAGTAVYYGLDRLALSRNAESILEVCGSYCDSVL
jgi:serine/threonine protein kinase